MYVLDVGEAADRLPELLRAASEGRDVVITREDGVAVRLVPVEPAPCPRFGSARGMFTMADDFDAPLEGFDASGDEISDRDDLRDEYGFTPEQLRRGERGRYARGAPPVSAEPVGTEDTPESDAPPLDSRRGRG